VNDVIEVPRASEGWVCMRCAALRGAHFLTCPVLRRPAGMSHTEFTREP